MRWRSRIFGWVWMSGVILSAILFLAAVGMWGRSYWRADRIVYTVANRQSYQHGDIGIRAGAVTFSYTHLALGPSDKHMWDWSIRSVPIVAPPPSTPLATNRTTIPYTESRWFGYEVWPILGSALGSSPGSRHTLTLPIWFIALLCLPLPLIAFRRWRKKRRIDREGLCRVCGYDLRASVQRCPECGTGFGSPNEQ
jgi:hypothetical protein